MEQRTKDGKGKQGSKTTSGFHMAVTSVTQAAGSLAVQQPPSPTSPSKKMFESLKETLQALNNKENTVINNEAVLNGIEPSADMMPAVDNQGSQINLSISQPVEPTVDQTLQAAEDAFFETMNQVKSIIMFQYLNEPKTFHILQKDILSRGIDDK